jgi:dienelactone hydrolase
MLKATILCMTLLASTVARGAIKTETVQYKQGDTVLKGYLAYDDSGAQKRPGVLVFGEWYGVNDYAKHRAEQLAALGYVAFAADVYGGGNVAKDPQEAGQLAGSMKKDPKLWLARSQAGLDTLKAQKMVDPSNVAAIGYCFGGTTALNLALSGADMKAVVSFHGGLPTELPPDAKPLKAKVLVCNGADDTFIKPEERAAFLDILKKAKADYVFTDYAGAVHAFTNPDAGKAGMQGVAYNEKADKRSWEHMKLMFKESLGA